MRELEEIQFDALREVANMGAGHAATALSEMTDRRIMISVPRLSVLPLDEVSNAIAEPETVVAGVMMHILGDLTGRTLLILPRDSAMRLCEILLQRDPGTLRLLGELEQSALREVGNILCAAYMNALSDFLGMMILPSVPSLVMDQCATVLTTACADVGSGRDFVLSIETRFRMGASDAVAAHFLLLPDAESLRVILRAIRLA